MHFGGLAVSNLTSEQVEEISSGLREAAAGKSTFVVLSNPENGLENRFWLSPGVPVAFLASRSLRRCPELFRAVAV